MLSGLEQRVKQYAIQRRQLSYEHPALSGTALLKWEKNVAMVTTPSEIHSVLIWLYYLSQMSDLNGFRTYEYCVISLSCKHVLKHERNHSSYNEYRKRIQYIYIAIRSLNLPPTKIIINLIFHVSGTQQETDIGLRYMKIKKKSKGNIYVYERNFIRNENVSCREILYFAFPIKFCCDN